MKKLVNLSGRLVSINDNTVQHYLKLGFVEPVKKQTRKSRTKKVRGKDE